jgi:hypothetical protein
MASRRAVATALKLLARAFAGEVDEARIDVYFAALDDVGDEQLAAAVTLVIKESTERFIPPPGLIRKAVSPTPAVDSAALIRRIAKLGQYSPHVGWIYPSVARVRDQLGDRIAYAYAAAGQERLYSENATTVDIAKRDFEQAFKESLLHAGSELPVVGASARKPSTLTSDDGDARLIAGGESDGGRDPP